MRIGKARCAPARAVVAGRLTGSIVVTDRLEVGAAAVIKGPVSAKSLAIARGAVIEGDMLVTSGEPVVQFEEKRAARRRARSRGLTAAFVHPHRLAARSR